MTKGTVSIEDTARIQQATGSIVGGDTRGGARIRSGGTSRPRPKSGT